MKHKNYDVIVAKAANMDLVVFEGNSDGQRWYEVDEMPVSDSEFIDYFLCLPQHKEVCLHWLNGGEVEENYDSRWDNIEPHSWHEQSVFNFDDGYTIRIKPKKEKRWIGVFKEGDLLKNTELSYKTKEQVMGDPYAPKGFDHWQFIEIEVEV